jgi:hypothetical protein
MTDKALGGPLAIDPTNLGNGWVPVDSGIDLTHERAVGLGADGDAAATHMHDGKSTMSVKLTCYATTGNLHLPAVGEILGAHVLTDYSLTGSQNGWPVLSMNLHQHDTNPHTAQNTFTCPVTIPAGVGIPTILADAATFATSTKLGYTLTMNATHTESQGSTGDHDAGETSNGECSLTLQFKGTADLAAAIASGGWSQTSKPTGNSSSDFDTSAYTLVKSVLRDE